VAAASHRSRYRGLSRRTTLVWLSFVAAMTVVTALLTVGDSDLSGGFLVATSVSALGQAQTTDDPIFQTLEPRDPGRWKGIVIHHLGAPAGDPHRIHRLHQSYGYQGLGYHFLIGNGSGLGDGIVHVGYRWNEQLPGAHVARVATDAGRHNADSIGICLIGNGDRRPFTERQMTSLLALVRSLQREYDIPASQVHLHSDLAPEITSPGRYFAAARFQTQMLD